MCRIWHICYIWHYDRYDIYVISVIHVPLNMFFQMDHAYAWWIMHMHDPSCRCVYDPHPGCFKTIQDGSRTIKSGQGPSRMVKIEREWSCWSSSNILRVKTTVKNVYIKELKTLFISFKWFLNISFIFSFGKQISIFPVIFLMIVSNSKDSYTVFKMARYHSSGWPMLTPWWVWII